MGFCSRALRMAPNRKSTRRTRPLSFLSLGSDMNGSGKGQGRYV
jgi:hypothetical protein